MSRFLKAVSFVVLGAVLVVAIQVSTVEAEHDGRCGLQQWERYILWMNFSEREYDEGGIRDRWVRAHGTICEPIWMDGPLKADASEYWPPLHFAVAAGTPLEQLKAEIDAASDAELARKDSLGRTLLHWAAIYRTDREREALKQALIERGVSPDDRDADGLTPRDWETRYESP